ncbi:S8 family peptidase [Alkalihalobacillus sp. AL-G]|uniref:S8 family peptidase n=1 Tax=Alkalihalobacillus sp. AL-G TaxID=2926399 RepID=UPI002729649E|nr:S8 family peptidase [Alkalihalobacillus sp. AL-G]WLD91598.1 S8 family peptidase [Alkalihalobacillus sp. AL-G]
MRFKSVAVILTSLFALALVFVFYPANEVEAPRGQGSEINPNSPQPLGISRHSDQLVEINSLEFGTKLVQKLNTDPSFGVITHENKVNSHFQEHEATVKFEVKPDSDELLQINKAIDGEVAEKLDSTYIFRAKSLSTPDLIDYFKKRNDVVFAEPNYIYLQNAITNDRLYQQYQWNLPAIQTEDGWNISRGNENVVIAVIDTGVDMKHPDLMGRLTDGYNVLTDSPTPNDDNGHGTHVAGIIASETNNGLGVAGMTWYNLIMPIKAMNAEGYGTSFNVAKGIRWATDHGADIINMSLGNYKASQAMKEAVDYANNKNVILVAATGNENTNQTSYPAGFEGVLGVAAVNQNLNRASFSNYGNYVDVAAPGVDIASTYLDGQYAALSGTSMATPHVSALAGLIRSLNPDLKNTEVLDIIKETTEDVGRPGKDVFTGSGVINIAEALQTANDDTSPNGIMGNWFND